MSTGRHATAAVRARPSAGPAPGTAGATTALVAAITTWIATLAWRGFTEAPERYLAPLAVLAAVVAGTGIVLRRWGAPGVVVVAVQVAAAGAVTCYQIAGSPLPVGAGWLALRAAFEQAQTTASMFAPPVPAEAPGVDPYFLAGGVGCLLLVDLLACTLRRAPLAGLPLLAVYAVPVGMLGLAPVWWIFVLTSLGYLLVLFLDQGDRVRRWGRALEPDAAVAAAGGRSGSPAAARWHATLVGGGVTAVAVVVPLVLPTLSLHVLDFGPGDGGDDDIEVVNPSVDLRRDLVRERDVPLLRVETDDPDPDYLRIAVLSRLSNDEWSSGDREIPADQVADGELPVLPGVSATVPRINHTYRVSATDAFDSTWLPVPSTATEVVARGDWRYDLTTRDFISSDDDLTTSGLRWSFSADELELSATDLAAAGSSAGSVASTFLDVPPETDPYVTELARQVTAQAPSAYEKAVALQNWFRKSGGFTYDLSVELDTSPDDLVRFLSPGPGGRTGYCEQFAAAMATMARELDIPARVAVGFLEPEAVGAGVFEYSSHDLHAWPELYIAGGGWVRFEPTPGSRAREVPGYTTESVVPENPDELTAPQQQSPDQVTPQAPTGPAPQAPEATDDTTGADDSGGWTQFGLGALGLLLVAAVASVPALVRRRRRERRRDGDVEAAWAELRDRAHDLGLRWPEARTPRETGAALATAVGGAEVRGPIDDLVARLERSRYAAAPGAADRDAVRHDLDVVLRQMRVRADPRAVRRAALLPRSIFRRTAPDLPVDASPELAAERLTEPV